MLVQTIGTKQHLTLVKLLVEARHRAGLNQTEVAARLRQRQAWLSHLESGQRRIDVVEFIAYCQAVGTNPCTLLRAVVKLAR